ncbi:acyltransferase family protein [Corynebacterium kroppenstedtii]
MRLPHHSPAGRGKTSLRTTQSARTTPTISNAQDSHPSPTVQPPVHHPSTPVSARRRTERSHTSSHEDTPPSFRHAGGTTPPGARRTHNTHTAHLLPSSGGAPQPSLRRPQPHTPHIEHTQDSSQTTPASDTPVTPTGATPPTPSNATCVPVDARDTTPPTPPTTVTHSTPNRNTALPRKDTPPATTNQNTPRAPHTPTGIRHVPGLDGLRGLAVMSVVIYHLFGNALPGGYLGVDVFFVLSGFLITSLLLREYVYSRTISLKNFWLRRLRRIAPAALSTLVIGSAIAGIIGGDVNVNLGRQFWSSALFVNNWVQISHAQSYFAQSELPIFAHYWSLSVEEQFYFLWPLIVFLLIVVLRKKPEFVGKVALTGLLLSALAMAIIVTPGKDATRVYYGTDTHAFGLFIGAALASVTISSSPHKRGDTWGYQEGLLKHGRILSALAIPALAVQLLYFFYLGARDTFTYRGGLISSSVVAAILVASVVRNRGPVAAIFRNTILRHLGFISFSLYLWHVPANLFTVSLLHDVEWGRKKWLTGLIAFTISVAASELSYRYIETPIRQHGFMTSARAITTTIVSTTSTRQQRLAGAMIPTAIVLCCVIAGVGIHNTSHGTALESELQRLQADNQAHRGATKPAPEVMTHDMPKDGTNITAIGDSVMLASQEKLRERFPGIDIDAEVSRHYQAASRIIDHLKEQHALRQFVFLGFGTNGQAFPGEIDQIITSIGRTHTIVIAMPYGDREYMRNAQKQVVDAAKKHSNVYAADWCEYANHHVSELASDGIHPRGNATAGYTNAFVTALKQWADGKKNVPPVCQPAG